MDNKYQQLTNNDPSYSKFIFGDDLQEKIQTIKNNRFLLVQDKPNVHQNSKNLTHFWPMFPFYTPWKHERFSSVFRG